MPMVNLLPRLKPHSQKILVRCEFDVPIANGQITDISRIKDAIPSLKFLSRGLGKVIILSHMGRPEGIDKSLSLKPCAAVLVELLNSKVRFVDDIVGKEAHRAVEELEDGEILLLQNLRFESGEEGKNLGFAKKLSSLGDFYVNESFSVCHRDHASISLLPTLLPSYAGLHLNSEVANLNKAVRGIDRPFIFIFGGKKADTKLKLLPEIAKIADWVLLGGTMFLENFKHLNNVIVPDDVVIGKKIGYTWEKKVIDWRGEEPGDDWAVYDIGPKTIKKFGQLIAGAQTVAWNGPVGWDEEKAFAEGTKEIAQMLAISKGFTVAGGGDTVAALDKFKLTEKLNFVSSGGGAMLEFIAGRELPGLKALGYYD